MDDFIQFTTGLATLAAATASLVVSVGLFILIVKIGNYIDKVSNDD